jgi:hypothetical protein
MSEHDGKLDRDLPRRFFRMRHLAAPRPVQLCDRYKFQANHCGARQGIEDNDQRVRGRALHYGLTAMRHSSKRPIVEGLPHIKGKEGLSDKPSSWEYVPPEGSGATLLKILCR